MSNLAFHRRVTKLLDTNRTFATALEKEIASEIRSYDPTKSDLGMYCVGRVGQREKLLSPMVAAQIIRWNLPIEISFLSPGPFSQESR